MPNHTSCVLRVVGPKASIDAFKEKAKFTVKDEEGKETITIFTFDSLLPMPPELVGTPSPSRVVTDEEYEKAVKEQAEAIARGDKWARMIGLPLTVKRQNDLMAKFGTDNWYDWAKNNWGTKWGVYDVSEAWEESPVNENKLGFGETIIQPDMVAIRCYFQSAWTPPSEGLRQISENFPDLKFTCGYADEGGGFLGYTIFRDGEETDTELPNHPWDGEQQIEFRRLCGQTIYEDEEDTDEDGDEEPAQLPESTNQ